MHHGRTVGRREEVLNCIKLTPRYIGYFFAVLQSSPEERDRAWQGARQKQPKDGPAQRLFLM